MTTPRAARIGLFGGTFDPVHLGHLLAAQEAHERLRLERVILMPAFIRPHKDRVVATSAADRLTMLRLAVGDDTRFVVSDLEIRRGGPSYTIDTVAALRAETAAEIVLLLGSDSVTELPAWHRVGELLDLCTLVVMARPGFALNTLDALHQTLPARQVERLRANLLPIPLIQISSTDVRTRFAAGRPVRYLVPRAVEEYIASRRLYRPSP
jgi:nicotinate-nucleotide adenylyltransferase